jgi:hypothetical protein
MIADDELYNNLLVKAKESRELHQLTISLYKAYYYNSEVRNLVNNIGNANTTEGPNDEGVSDVISQMRNNLAMQTFLLNDVANTLEDGVEGIKEAYATGSSVPVGPNSEIKFTQNAQGTTDVRLIQMKNSENSQETISETPASAPMTNGLTAEEVNAFREMLAIFRKQQTNIFSSNVQEVSQPIVQEDVQQDVGETTSLNENSQAHSIEEEQPEEIIAEIQEVNTDSSEEDTEALDLLDDLLGSLV